MLELAEELRVERQPGSPDPAQVGGCACLPGGFAGVCLRTTGDIGEGRGKGSQTRSRDVSRSKNSWVVCAPREVQPLA